MNVIVPEITLPASGRYLLLSDLHLGDGGRRDLARGRDASLLAFLDGDTADMDAVVLAGDILDGWQTDRADAIVRAHPRVVARLAALAAERPTYLVLGNHDRRDFIDALLPQVRTCQALALDTEALVIHGHQLDVHFGGGPLDGKGNFSLKAHKAVEQLTGQFIRLPFAEFDNPTNRFAHWVFYRLTMAARLYAQLQAGLGRPYRLRRWAAHHDYWARSQWGDNHAMLIPALNLLARIPQRRLIVGHSHQPGVVAGLSRPPTGRVSGEPGLHWREGDRRVPEPAELDGKEYVNLGSWTFGQSTYTLWDGGALQLRDHVTGESTGSRSYDMALTAQELPGMREWWVRYYRGLLRYDSEAIQRDFTAIR